MTEAKKKILITGSSGRIGHCLTKHLGEQYSLILTDIREPEKQPGHPFFKVDVTDLAAVRDMCQDVDTVVHLAANASPRATWDELYPANIVGINTLFQAAHEAGCRRVIFASSGQAVYGYADDVQIHADMPPRPLNLYGATKVWGETIGRYYAEQKGLSTICLRLGWVVKANSERIHSQNKNLKFILTYRDMAQLFSRCIVAPDDLHFGIFNGVSDNRRKRLDISQARAVLGYEPQDDAYALAKLVTRKRKRTPVRRRIKRKLLRLFKGNKHSAFTP